jgi:hypothetical protein
VAGVINVISKKPESQRPQLQGMATYGSYNSFKANANLSQKRKWLEYDVNYVYFNTDWNHRSKGHNRRGRISIETGFHPACNTRPVLGINARTI